MKERLIGAAVLVVIGVWLIPWILDGPESLPEPESGTLELPAAQESAQMRTQTIDLDERRTTTTRNVALPPASSSAASRDGHSADVASAERSESATRLEVAAADRDAAGRNDEPTVDSDAAARNDEPAAHSDAAGARDERVAHSDVAAAAADDEQSTPAPAPDARRAGVPEGGWVVQLGAFGEEANASRLADRVSTYGYEADVSAYRAGGRLMHRVRVGPHETRNQAEAIASSLSAHGFVAQVVTVD